MYYSTPKKSSGKYDLFSHLLPCLAISIIASCPAIAADKPVATAPAVTTAAPDGIQTDYSVGEVIYESIFGNVYAEPSRWQDLELKTLFSKGWDKPWASPPNGKGDGPRQGWLNAYDGVFYRLSIATFGWQHNLNGGDGYNGNLTTYTPLNQRLEIQTDIPLVSATRSPTDSERKANFGDFQITPRLLLTESHDTTQTFNLTFRTPTGDSYNGNGVASITPNYQFWTNWWKGLIVRGGAGFSVPYAGNIQQSGARTTVNGNLAVGYYFTPHNYSSMGNMVNIGDMVWYVSGNFNQALDSRAYPLGLANFSLTPGFRTHVGNNWYLLGAVEVPVTYPKPYDYQVLGGIMKVY